MRLSSVTRAATTVALAITLTFAPLAEAKSSRNQNRESLQKRVARTIGQILGRYLGPIASSLPSEPIPIEGPTTNSLPSEPIPDSAN